MKSGKVDWKKCKNLVPTIVQDLESREVLMLAYSSKKSLERALKKRQGWYYSRSRKKLWRKGATSGNTQKLVKVLTDCDADTLLFMVKQKGNACHLGKKNCFFQEVIEMEEEKKVIPCLDCNLSSGKTELVKGINFKEVKAVGNPVEQVKRYCAQGADEIVVLDINATVEGRKTGVGAVQKMATACSVPLVVGGGIRSVAEAEAIIAAGAAKVGVNTAAVENPQLISQLSQKLGKQAVVSAIDAQKVGKSWNVFVKAGTEDTGLDAVKWAKKVESLGAGSILLTSINRDGTKKGFDLSLTRAVSEAVAVPVIASGGAGSLEDMYRVLVEGKASAVLGASIFHYGKLTVEQVKEYLKRKGLKGGKC